jgi:WD40 repeat protein/serine/threonine protein kinase
MMPVAACPNTERLQEHLEGLLSADEQTELLAHLDTCAVCQQTLEGLGAGSEAILETARQIGREPRPLGAAFQEVLRVLKQKDSVAGSPNSPPGGEALVSDFLSSSEQSGHLGRLGHYEVIEVVGRGSMGVVLKALDQKLQRVVGIKLLAPHLAASAIARRRFVREARAAAAVRHEHVIDLHAVEEANGLPYLVMEYISGQSLQDRLNLAGPLELREILRIGMQTATGLAAAHAQGVIHRDIKPANILLENGVARVKITDFGLARAGTDESISQNGVVTGTPQYMAPEQARGDMADQRADLFSLGSVLYAMCTGLAPFSGNCALAVLKRVCEDTPRPIQEINPEIPNWLAAVIEKLHAKGPAKRFQSAIEVAELLGQHLARLQQPSPPGTANSRSKTPRVARSSIRVRRGLIAAAVLLLLLGGLGVTEATGVTKVVPLVIHIVRGDGSLVVQVDDPQVRVSVEGDGGIVITGAGPQEIRLRPGSYRLRASKDGKTVREELVTLMRGDRQVVRVSHEGGPQAAAGVSEAPPAAVPSRRFEGHTGPILCLALSREGRLALSGSVDRTVRLWDVASGREQRRFEGHSDEVAAVAFSHSGKKAVSGGGDRSIRLWDVNTAHELGCWWGHTDKVQSLALSWDDQFVVSGSHDGTVRLWDVAKGVEVRSLQGHKGWVTSVAISRDGRTILSGGNDGTVRIWDLPSGKQLHCLEGHMREVYSVAFAPDGRRAVSGGNDRTVRIWDVEGGKELHRLDGHVNAIVCVAFAADGRQVFSASSQYQVIDKTLRIWDAASGRELGSFGGAITDRLGCAAFCPEGQVALSGSAEPALRLWKLSP